MGIKDIIYRIERINNTYTPISYQVEKYSLVNWKRHLFIKNNWRLIELNENKIYHTRRDALIAIWEIMNTIEREEKEKWVINQIFKKIFRK